jgi:hypothetical protein
VTGPLKMVEEEEEEEIITTTAEASKGKGRGTATTSGRGEGGGTRGAWPRSELLFFLRLPRCLGPRDTKSNR